MYLILILALVLLALKRKDKKDRRRIVFRVLLTTLILIIGYLAFNQIDALPYQSSLVAPPALPPSVFEKTNGFYRLWTLCKPKDVDIETDAAILPYRRLFDPAFDNDSHIRNFIYRRENCELFCQTPKELKLVFQAMEFGVDWLSTLNQYQEQLVKARDKYGFMLARYEKLITTEFFIEFTLMRHDAPIPKLLAWRNIAKLSIALDIMTAQKGNLSEAAKHLLNQLQFATKVIANSRTTYTNYNAKVVARLAIWALSNLINHKDCPPQVIQLVYENTNPLSLNEYSSRTPLIWEMHQHHGLEFDVANEVHTSLEYKLFYQTKRTINARIRYMEEIIHCEETHPHFWKVGLEGLHRQVKGVFWWLQNPLGKKDLDDEHNFYINVVLYQSWALKTQHDMLHIIADLHRSFDPARSVQWQLNDLSSYRELLDPCSGKNYIWNDQKKILYSIGIDRHDNRGEPNDYYSWQDSDYILQVKTSDK